MSKNLNLRSEFECVSAALGGQATKVLGYCKPEDFFDQTNANIIWAIKGLTEADNEITVASICDYLRLHEKLTDDVLTYIEHAASIKSESGETSARLVGELAARRRLSSVLKSTASDLDIGELTSSQAAETITSQIFKIAAPGSAESRPINEIIIEVNQNLERLARGDIVGYTTALPTVDQTIMGIHRTETAIIIGTPGSGKSIWGEDILLANAIHGNKKCAAYILEMSAEQWVKRAIARHTDSITDSRQLRGSMTENTPSIDQNQLADARNTTAALASLGRNLFVEDKKFSKWEIQQDMLRRVENDGTELFLIDYYQLMHGGDGTNRVGELSEISRSFRGFALKHNISIIGIAKMNKAGAGAAFREEQMNGTEIEGSSSFEYDASIIMSIFLKKPKLICDCKDEVLLAYERKNKKPKHETNEYITCGDCNGFIRKATKRLGWISVIKSRDGAVDDRIPIIFNGPKLHLSELQ